MTKKMRIKTRLLLLALVALLLSPIAFYVLHFGTTISNDHARWAEMGSAMAGIYTPILAILTLVVLLAQVHLQSRMNEHTFDQSFIQDARADLHFYLEQLVNELLTEFDDGSNLRDALIETFAYARPEHLTNPDILEIAAAIDKRNHRLVSIWSAIYGIVVALKTNDYPPYTNNYATTKQKAIAMLSYSCCAALDNLVWCTSEGRLNFPYEFSGALRAHSSAA